MTGVLLLPALAVLAGLVALAWSSDRLVVGAAALAESLSVSPLLVGVTIVALGTAAPELLVSALASWEGRSGLAIGNAMGSNIINFGLVLGAVAVVRPMIVSSGIIRREYLILLAVTGLTLLLLISGQLTRLDGWILLLVLVGYLVWLYQASKGDPEHPDPVLAASTAELPEPMARGRALFWLITGLVVLLISARAVVWGAVVIAESLGVSDLVIGVTVIALGTSLPELAATLAAALRNQFDIAMGNLVGSNIFNLLGVLGLAAAVHPVAVSPETLIRDFPSMVIISGLVLLFSLNRAGGGRGRIGRLEGGLLLLAYAGWAAWLTLDLMSGTRL